MRASIGRYGDGGAQMVTVAAIDGHAAGVPILRAALSAFRDETALPPEESRWLSFACRASWDIFDEESWRLLATRALADLTHSHARTKEQFSNDGFDNLRQAVAHLPSIGGWGQAWRAPLEAELARCRGIDTQDQWTQAAAAATKVPRRRTS